MEPPRREAGRRRRLVDRLLTTRVRTTVLVALSVVLFGLAIIIGLPPQTNVPTGLGRIVVLPVLPAADDDGGAYSVRVGWNVRHEPPSYAVLVTDSFWSQPGVRDSDRGLPIYLAVPDDATADALVACSSALHPEATGAPALVEVTTLPPEQRSLLERLDRYEYGGLLGSRYLRVDDLAPVPSTWPVGACNVEPSTLVTRDDVELHLAAPNITIVVPAPSDTRSGDMLEPYVTLWALPAGWSPQDVRARSGTQTDGDFSIIWRGTEVTSPRPGSADFPKDVKVLSVGPVTFEATSLNAQRRADRALFWSGLLVGIAGSCLLMLFESLPWRGAPTTQPPTPPSPAAYTGGREGRGAARE